MGQTQSTAGRQLLSVVQENNTAQLRLILQEHPGASCYATCIDRNSPLLLAAGRGHARMVQAILEAAVISQGLTRAKKRCINHSNSKGQSALMLACIHGHAQCAEVLVQNGASPLVLDNARHNSALHWAASCCRADCVGRLLGSGALFQMQSGQLVAIAEIPCFDEDNATLVKFVDRHNGWGLTALHLATFKGSSSTVRALLRHGASLSARTTVPTLSHSPMLHPPGSTALHFAATAEDMSLVLVLLEAQVSRNDPDMRRATNANGQRPIDVAPSSISANPLLLQLLDPSHALSLHPGPRTGIVLNPGSSMSRVVTREGLRHHQALLGLSSGSGFRGSRRGLGADGQPPHVALGALLQRLKLVLSLEAFALQQQLAAAAAAAAGSAGGSAAAVAALLAQKVKQQQVDAAAAAAGEEGECGDDVIGTAPAADAAPGGAGAEAGISSDVPEPGPLHVARTASSGVSSTLLEISPGSSSGDDTRTVSDAQQQQQQQQQSAAQAAAQQVRLKQLQHMAAAVDDLLALLPASATAKPASPSASGSSSPRRQQQQGGTAGRHISSSVSSGSWGLLGGLLARNTTGSPDQQLDTLQQQQQQQLSGRRRSVRSRRGSDGTGTGTGSDSSPAATAAPLSEEVLSAYITASMLSSLAAVTKLFVGASSLSGQQQQQQGTSGGGSHARWADQEHALLLMKGVIKTLRTTLEAAQQAAAAAASRTALRQRHQQQLASLLGSDSRPVHSHSLRRALLGERLLLEQGRIRFGSGATTGTTGSSSSRHDGSLAAAYLGAGMGMSLDALDAPLAVSSLPAAGGGRHHSSRRHHHRERARRLRGEDGGSDGGQQDTRRHRRHHSRHASRSGRRRTPRAVDLPMHDLLPTADLPSSRQPVRDTETPAAGPSDTESRNNDALLHQGPAAAAAAAGSEASSLVHMSQQQQQQQQAAAGLHPHSSSSRTGQGGGSEIQPSPAAGAASSGAGAAAASQSAVSLHSANSSSSSSHSSTSSHSSRGSALADQQDDDTLAVDDAAHLSSDSDKGPGLDGSLCSSLDATTCAICMDCTAGVSVSRCSHSLCLQCAYQLCCKAKGLPLCPFCRQPIDGFGVAAAAAASGGS